MVTYTPANNNNKKTYSIEHLIYLFIYLFTRINKAKPVNPDPMYVTNLC